MPLLRFCALAGLTLLLVPLVTRAARADDRVTITVAPVYIFNTEGDANAPSPPGFTGIGYTNDKPLVSTYRFDYGLDVKLDPKTHVYYSHSNAAYQLGRILTLAPKTSFVSGSIFDYTDTFGVSYAAFKGVGVHVSYFNHQRSDVTGLCLNQKYCAGPTGAQIANPLSINSHGYELGVSYDFGPPTIVGPLFNAGVNLDYYTRPSTPPAGAALGGLGHWVGSTTEVPYSLTVRLPITSTPSFIPTVTYINLPVLYEDSAVPEAYRGFVWGFTKVIDKYASFSYMNYDLKSCTCIARVPPPDNLRLTWGEMKLDLHVSL